MAEVKPCGQWCFLTIAPFLYKNIMHLSADKVGLLMALSASFFILGATLASRLLNRLGIDKLLVLVLNYQRLVD